MVWVWPPHTSMNLYWRPGQHSAAILADSAWALSASRNSSTNFMTAPLLDPGFGERFQLVGVGLADPFQERQGGRGLGLIDLGQGEADVDQHPLARDRRGGGQQPDVDHPPDAADVHPGQIRLLQELDHLTRYAEAHAHPLLNFIGYQPFRSPAGSPGPRLRRRPPRPGPTGPGRARPSRARRPRPGSGPARPRACRARSAPPRAAYRGR